MKAEKLLLIVAAVAYLAAPALAQEHISKAACAKEVQPLEEVARERDAGVPYSIATEKFIDALKRIGAADPADPINGMWTLDASMRAVDVVYQSNMTPDQVATRMQTACAATTQEGGT